MMNESEQSRADKPRELRAVGVARMHDNDQAVLVCFDRKPTDDELREVHDTLAGRPTARSAGTRTVPVHPTGITFEQFLSYQPWHAPEHGGRQLYDADTVRAAWAAGAQCDPSGAMELLVEVERVLTSREPSTPMYINTLLESVRAFLRTPRSASTPLTEQQIRDAFRAEYVAVDDGLHLKHGNSEEVCVAVFKRLCGPVAPADRKGVDQ